MVELWKKIEIILGRIAPEALEELASPSTNDAVNQLEQQIGSESSDLIESLRIHDGQRFGYHSLADPWRLMQVEEIVRQSQHLTSLFSTAEFEDGREARGPVKPEVWLSAWFPFAADNVGNYLCADFAPDQGGRVEQVILWAADPPYVEVVASSYRAWLEQFATDLETGKFIWDAETSSWSRVVS